MTRRDRTDESSDRHFAEELVFSPCGLALEDRPTANAETPDFWILKYASRRALCELKSLRDDALIDALESERARDLEAPIVSASIVRDRNHAARVIGKHVKKAISQFLEANPDHALPNVLVIVNHADGWHMGDLREVVTGMFHADDGEAYPTEVDRAKGIGAERLAQVDLYIWIDRRKATVDFIWKRSERHDAAIRDLFLPVFRQAREV